MGKPWQEMRRKATRKDVKAVQDVKIACGFLGGGLICGRATFVA